jgi:hypothetical protein
MESSNCVDRRFPKHRVSKELLRSTVIEIGGTAESCSARAFDLKQACGASTVFDGYNRVARLKQGYNDLKRLSHDTHEAGKSR